MSLDIGSFYPESKFGGFTRCDGTVAFYARIQALLKEDFHVLDVGCGRGQQLEEPCSYRKELRIIKGTVSKVTGIDVDVNAAENPTVDEFQQMTIGEPWPAESGSFDLVFSDHVLEHVDDPDLFFSESARVLKPGGYLCLRTPNSWSYVALISRLIPNRFHASVVEAVQEGRKEEDVFPTLYRCNSRRRIGRQLRKHEFEGVVLGHHPEPGYLAFSKFAYALGVLWQKCSPSGLAPSLLAFARLKDAPH